MAEAGSIAAAPADSRRAVRANGCGANRASERVEAVGSPSPGRQCTKPPQSQPTTSAIVVGTYRITQPPDSVQAPRHITENPSGKLSSFKTGRQSEMQSALWLFAALAALTAPSAHAYSAAFAAFAASTAQCSSVSTCYEGGAESTPCTVSSGGCPPCVTFADDGCYVMVDGACPFGVDCTDVWSSGTSTSSGSASSTTTSSTSTSSTTGTSSSTTTTTTSSTTGSSPSTAAGTSSKSATGTSGTAGVSSSASTASSTAASGSSDAATAGDSSSGGSDMSVVFAIIGAAIGVIAVAVIFLTLVRRSKAAHEDEDDDLANTPPAFSKNPVVQAPHSTTNTNAMYSSYNGSNRAPGMGSGTAGEIGLDQSKGLSVNAVSYYNQQPPQNSTAPSPRVAGRAIPSQPVGLNQSTGMGRPYGSNHNFQASGGQNFGTSGAGVTVVSQAPPTPVQHLPMGGVAPSPHSRRESYEF